MSGHSGFSGGAMPPFERMFFGSWPDFFMSMAFFVGMKSKDRYTKVGAVIVNEKHQIVSMGYNGFARHINDKDPRRHERPLKYSFTIHAERNALYNASGRVEGCWMYTPWFPCPNCADTIINFGIKRVVHFWPMNEGMGDQSSISDESRQDWKSLAEISNRKFIEAGVQTEVFYGSIYDGGILQVANGVVSFPRRSSSQALDEISSLENIRKEISS